MKEELPSFEEMLSFLKSNIDGVSHAAENTLRDAYKMYSKVLNVTKQSPNSLQALTQIILRAEMIANDLELLAGKVGPNLIDDRCRHTARLLRIVAEHGKVNHDN